MTTTSSQSPVATELKKRLMELSPTLLEIEDNSIRHAGHAGIKGLASAETHFVIRIGFAPERQSLDMSHIHVHRLVYQAVGDLMDNPIHAINIEWIR